MKRSPLARKTPLTSRAPLTGGAAPLRRTALNKVSRKRVTANRERTAALKPLRESQSWCSKCGRTGVGLDAHELLSRGRGGSITDLANIVLLCRDCHQWVTAHPSDAEALGWAFKSGAASR